jgi:hypothetical protein
MDNAKSYHVAGLYLALAWLLTILPSSGPATGAVTNVISFLLIWGGIHILFGIARRRWNARRLRRIAGEAGSETEEGYDMGWMDRPL